MLWPGARESSSRDATWQRAGEGLAWEKPGPLSGGGDQARTEACVGPSGSPDGPETAFGETTPHSLHEPRSANSLKELEAGSSPELGGMQPCQHLDHRQVTSVHKTTR